MLFRSFPTERAWGALLPYTPSGDGCERVHTLSRSPGAILLETLVSDEARGRSGEDFGFRRNERGARCSPTPPRVTGTRGLRPSRALPGLSYWKVWFLTGHGAVLVRIFVSDGTGRERVSILSFYRGGLVAIIT